MEQQENGEYPAVQEIEAHLVEKPAVISWMEDVEHLISTAAYS